MESYFICNQDEIESKLKNLIKTRSSQDGWTHYYLDESTKEEWFLTTYGSEYHGGGMPVLKRLPFPSTDELIDIALNSSNRNDIIGASRELSERERYNKESFREKLLLRLLQPPALVLQLAD
jgi:hypothetical protein